MAFYFAAGKMVKALKAYQFNISKAAFDYLGICMVPPDPLFSMELRIP
jgi:hypothetical protein